MPTQIRVVICAGTTCHLMGGSYLFLIEERLSPQTRARVVIEGSPCLDRCKPGAPGGTASGAAPGGGAPYATVDGRLIGPADPETLAKAIEARARELGA